MAFYVEFEVVGMRRQRGVVGGGGGRGEYEICQEIKCLYTW